MLYIVPSLLEGVNKIKVSYCIHTTYRIPLQSYPVRSSAKSIPRHGTSLEIFQHISLRTRFDIFRRLLRFELVNVVSSANNGRTRYTRSEVLHRRFDGVVHSTRVVDPSVPAPCTTVALCFRGHDHEIAERGESRGGLEEESLRICQQLSMASDVAE